MLSFEKENPMANAGTEFLATKNLSCVNFLTGVGLEAFAFLLDDLFLFWPGIFEIVF